MDIGAALGDGVSLTLSLLAWMVGGLIVIAAIDAPYQWFSHANKLKMSRQEVRDEYKQAEGSPEVKGRLRRLQQERSRQRMIKSEEHTSELQSLMRISYAVFCLKKKKKPEANKLKTIK